MKKIFNNLGTIFYNQNMRFIAKHARSHYSRFRFGIISFRSRTVVGSDVGDTEKEYLYFLTTSWANFREHSQHDIKDNDYTSSPRVQNLNWLPVERYDLKFSVRSNVDFSVRQPLQSHTALCRSGLRIFGQCIGLAGNRGRFPGLSNAKVEL